MTTAPEITEQTSNADELDTPWLVIVWNDPINTMPYVTLVFKRVLGMSEDLAVKRMLEVHNNGKSVVYSGGKEKAEHYVHQLIGYSLNTTLEKSTRS